MRILVIEDDDGVRESLVAILREEGYTVDQVTSGAEALERLRTNELPDLILLDLMMPTMDGQTFREAQLHDARLARVPVIVVSARPDVAEVAHLVGVKDYLRKPMSFDALLELVRSRAGHEGGGVFTLEGAHSILRRPR